MIDSSPNVLHSCSKVTLIRFMKICQLVSETRLQQIRCNFPRFFAVFTLRPKTTPPTHVFSNRSPETGETNRVRLFFHPGKHVSTRCSSNLEVISKMAAAAMVCRSVPPLDKRKISFRYTKESFFRVFCVCLERLFDFLQKSSHSANARIMKRARGWFFLNFTQQVHSGASRVCQIVSYLRGGVGTKQE